MSKSKKMFISLFAIMMLFIIVPVLIPFAPSSHTVQAFDFNVYYKTLTKGKTYTIKLKKTSKKAKWYSSNKRVASVNSKGKVTAKKAGTAFITAKIGRSKCTAKIKVKNPPIKLNKSKITLIKGNKYSLKVLNTNKKVRWKVNNTKVAKINSKGVVTAVGKGVTHAKATVNGKTYSCKLTVQAPYFSSSFVNLYVNTSKTNALKGTTMSKKYKSSNTSVAKVSSTGKVTGIRPGNTTITAYIGKRKYSYKVTVKNNPTTFTGWKTINGKKYYYIKNVKAKGFKTINGRKYFFDDNGVLSSQFGIDVSGHQKEIDWDKVKADGVEFAILRCGYGMNQTDQDDSQFLRNVAECKRLHIPYGIYLYSYANTIEKGLSEAEHVLRLINESKANPTLGVWYDVEDNIQVSLKPEFLAEIIDTFCSKIKKEGYSVGIYASLQWLTNKLDPNIIKAYDIWLSHWTEQNTSYSPYVMWQYTDNGSIDGIKTKVDFNIRLK